MSNASLIEGGIVSPVDSEYVVSPPEWVVRHSHLPSEAEKDIKRVANRSQAERSEVERGSESALINDRIASFGERADFFFFAVFLIDADYFDPDFFEAFREVDFGEVLLAVEEVADVEDPADWWSSRCL